MQDSVEAEVMTAAQARIGEGPLRAAEGKEPKALQSEVTHLMSTCEKLRARKRFFANKVEEINNPRAAVVQPSHSCGAGPGQPSHDPGAGPDRPSSAAPSRTSFPVYTPRGSPSPSEQMQLIDTWVISPPITRAVSPNADADMIHAAADHTDAGDMVHHTSDAKPTALSKPDGGADVMDQAGLSMHQHLDTQGAEQQASQPSSPSSSHCMQTQCGSQAAQQHSGGPESSQGTLNVHVNQHVQLARQTLSLTWADGVRAPVGVALAVGPWALTSAVLPVSTQPVQQDIIDLASTSPAGSAGLGAHDRTAASSHPSIESVNIAAAGSPPADATLQDLRHDHAHADSALMTDTVASGEATDEAAAAAAMEVSTRESSPDGDSSSSQMCNVCLCPIRQLIIVLQPCGHYYCENCTASIRAVANPRCPECRTRISSTFRVPLSSSQTHTHKEDAQHAQVLQH